MNETLLQELRRITPEEQKILDGNKSIEETIYVSAKPDVIDASKLLERGKLITVRPATRFVYFPKHTHNYIEVIYMCEGRTHQVINGQDLMLHKGELLFLSRHAVQEIYPAGENDIAVNFIILPEFFDVALAMMGSDRENPLYQFVVNALRGDNEEDTGYLHFKVADILPIQNLLENLVWTIWNKNTNKRSILQATMGLLFLQLLNHMDLAEVSVQDEKASFQLAVLSYIEENYKEGELTELAKIMHYDTAWLSKEIKKIMGSNYTDLVQAKRLSQAAYLLENTGLSVLEVGEAVGYDNQSYFHRIFAKKYEMTPRKYRMAVRSQKEDII